MDGTVDETFNPIINNYVLSVILQPDGKIVIGGVFTTVNGQPRNHIARLNADGTLDMGFDPDANDVVYPMTLQPDGKILVGGAFTKLAGKTNSCLARLNADGTFDESFLGSAGSTPLAILLQKDGKIVVGGGFSALSGQPSSRIGRLNQDGTLDVGFDPQASAPVRTLALQTDGRILVAGDFTSLGGQSRDYIGRINSDGTPDPTFAPRAGTNFYALCIQPDGKVLVGGDFRSLAGQTRNRLGRLNNTEAATENFGFDGNSIMWMRGGTGPEFGRATFDFSTNGFGWESIGNGERIDGGWQVTGLNLPMDASIRARGYVVGGRYECSTWFVEKLIGPLVIVNQPVSRTNNAGTAVTFSVEAQSPSVLSYQWLKNGIVLTNGGNISGVNTPVLSITNLTGVDAGSYTVMLNDAQGSSMSSEATLTVIDPFIITQPVSQYVHAGQTAAFSVKAAGAALNYQWRKDGNSIAGATASSLTFTNAQGSDIASYDVVVGSQYGAVTSVVASLTVNLATLDSFNPGADKPVTAIALDRKGRILLGGYFASLGGVPRSQMGRLNGDGTLDAGFNPGSIGGSNYRVDCLGVQADERILVGGNFGLLGGQNRYLLGRLNEGGTLDTMFNPQASGFYPLSSSKRAWPYSKTTRFWWVGVLDFLMGRNLTV